MKGIVSKKKTGSLLVELVIALSIGMVVLLQLTTFLLAFVQHMHGIADNERRLLQESVVVDLLMQDIATSVEQSALDGNVAGIALTCWRLRVGEKFPRLIYIIWKKVGVRIHRHIEGMSSPQVFGDLLRELVIDCHVRTVQFVDEENRLRTYGF